MDINEYKQKVKELESEFKNKKIELMKQFVTANNPYIVGDKVTDHIGTVLVEKIGYSWGMTLKPCATYFGTVLTKNGTPSKRGDKRTVYQSNINKI